MAKSSKKRCESSSAAGPASKSAKKATAPPASDIPARVIQKLREALPFKSLDGTEKFIVVDPLTNLTLQHRMERDIRQHEAGEVRIEWGNTYNKRIADLYRSPNNMWSQLAVPAADASSLSEKLHEAAISQRNMCFKDILN